MLQTLGSRAIAQLLQFGGTIVLARLLTPDEFGLVAIVVTFTGFAALFTDLGLGAAVVHQKRLSEADVATAFWLNALTGVVLTGLFLALAWPLSEFYERPELFSLIAVGSLSFTLSLNVVHSALLQRTMRFGAITVLEICSTGFSVGTSIGCAALGLGAMSLVIGSLASTVSSSIVAFYFVRWVPRQFFDRASFAILWQYCRPIFGFNVVNYWARNADNLTIGKVGSAAQLALYNRAYSLMMLPIFQVTQVLGRVLFPALSGVRDEPERIRRGYVRSCRLIMSLGAPMTVGLAVCSTSFITVVYGQRWVAAAPLLAILAASGPAQLISSTFGPLYQATGRTKTLFRRGMVTTFLTLIAIAVGAIWGATGVAVGLLIKFYVAMPIAANGCLPALGLTVWKLVRLLLPIVGACVIMALGMLGLLSVTESWRPVAELALLVGAGGTIYLLALYLLAPDVLRELKSVLSRGAA